MSVEATVVVETFTLCETSSWERVEQTLAAAARMVEAHGDAELVVLDVTGEDEVAHRLGSSFAGARRVAAAGLSYDAAKGIAAQEARGTYIAYLDGDCLPERDDWLERHLEALRAGAVATGGFTRYEGGFRGALESVLDFGFMLPARPRTLACYASNNVAFRRDLVVEVPVPDGPMRCRCFAHSQTLLRRGTPVRYVPEARVRHERQPFVEERLRQGFDEVAALWTDPGLPLRPLLRLGPLALPPLYARAVLRDWQRLAAGRRDLGLSRAGAAVAAVLLPVARLVDAGGMLRALLPGGRTSRFVVTGAPAGR